MIKYYDPYSDVNPKWDQKEMKFALELFTDNM
jgi:hypothetical protein